MSLAETPEQRRERLRADAAKGGRTTSTRYGPAHYAETARQSNARRWAWQDEVTLTDEQQAAADYLRDRFGKDRS